MALALARPLVAIDLPGHGHSDGGKIGARNLLDNADDVAVTIRELAPDAAAVVGMSLGGLTSIALADRHTELVRKLGDRYNRTRLTPRAKKLFAWLYARQTRA